MEPNAIVFCSGNVKASQLMPLKYFRGDLVIQGNLIVNMDLKLKCNLYVNGKIHKERNWDGYSITIKGNLWCKGEISCNDMIVQGSLYCANHISYAGDIYIGGDFCCNGQVYAYNRLIIVAGDIDAESIIAQRVEYLGNITVAEQVNVVHGIIRHK